jgi:hypothetical protein
MKVLLALVAAALCCAASVNALAAIQANDKLPWANLHFGFPPQLVNTASYAADKNMLIIGLPGAFTPT